MTVTQGIFICCLFVGGPGFGFFAAYRAFGTPEENRFHFMFGAFAAYAGWFLSGMSAMIVHPGYPLHGPAETIMILYTLPGFLTGIAGLQALKRFRQRRVSHDLQ